MGASFFITCYNRTDYLRRCMDSWHLRDDIKVIILDDNKEGDTDLSEICIENRFHYIHTGANKKYQWRVPGFAINIGVKYFPNDIMVVSCAEIFHINEALLNIVDAVYENKKAIAYCDGWLEGRPEYAGRPLNTKLPFLMGWNYDTFINIGGYDEDFIGYAYDDNDIVERLQGAGCVLNKVKGNITHLWHEPDTGGKYKIGPNKEIYEAKKGTIIRNIGKEWGVL